MGLDNDYWTNLGQPSARRMERLPMYARLWIESLKQRALFWHAKAQGREFDPRMKTYEPTAEQLATLPLWAQDWIATLKFECRWQRDQVPATRTTTQRNLF